MTKTPNYRVKIKMENITIADEKLDSFDNIMPLIERLRRKFG